MNHTAFILGPTFTALCYNIVYNVVKSGEIQHLKLDISTTCVNIVLRENRYGLTFRSMSDLGLKKFMKQISLIITNIDRNRTFSRRIECLKLIWGLGMCSGKYEGKRSIRNNYNKIVIKHCWVFSATHAKKARLVQRNINIFWLEELTIMHFP